MAQPGRIFRIFVSSTFADLQEERNALQKRVSEERKALEQEVFPALKKLCAENDCQFQAIDLRWGVGEEAGLDQRTMRICLEELKRCQTTSPRPNFILLLGDRYGWRPLPEEIPDDEFRAIERRVEDSAHKKLIAEWYVRDENATPAAVYCLQPRTGKFADFEVWQPVEEELRSILLDAVNTLKLSPEERVKYVASATEQEVIHGALRVEHAGDHIFCFFREIENLPKDKRAEDYIDLKADGKADPEAEELLKQLKERLRKSLPGNCYEYKAEWVGDGITTNHIHELCRDVYRSLEKVILDEIESIKAKPYLEREIEDHAVFGESRARFFVGRSEILQTVRGFISGKNDHPLAIYGEGGSGKSALMAFALKQARERHPRAEMVSRFIGATLHSSDVRALLEDLCRQISRAYGVEDAIPTTYEDLVQEFPRRLASASADKPLILFLDSLDQLSAAHNARSLAWLPAELPEHVRLIATTRPGEPLNAFRNKLPPDHIFELEPMSREEGARLLDEWLGDAGRTVQDFQRKEILNTFSACGWPLYLKLAFEEARIWKSYTKEITLAADTEGIIRDNLFRRLESDHGRTLLARCLGYIAATREMMGLAEDELLEILSLDNEFFDQYLATVRHKPPERKLPVAVWSRLYFDLEPYLSGKSHEGTALLTFFHRELGEVAQSKYLAGHEAKYQQVLAEYFLSKADPEVDSQTKRRNKTWKGIPRALSEVPFHLGRAGRWDELFETLVDFQFLEQKAARVGVQESIDAKENRTTSYTGALALLEDYDTALKEFPKE